MSKKWAKNATSFIDDPSTDACEYICYRSSSKAKVFIHPTSHSAPRWAWRKVPSHRPGQRRVLVQMLQMKRLFFHGSTAVVALRLSQVGS